jgi:hypothetical protein
LTINFSLFFPVSEGFVTSAGLELSFSGTGFAAHRDWRSNNRKLIKVRKMKIDMLATVFIKPQKSMISRPLIIRNIL